VTGAQKFPKQLCDQKNLDLSVGENPSGLSGALDHFFLSGGNDHLD